MTNSHILTCTILSTDLAAALELNHLGATVVINAIASSEGAGPGRLTFGVPRSHGARGVWITASDIMTEHGCAAIVSDNPRLDFIRALDYMRSAGYWPSDTNGNVSESARVHPSAIIHSGAEVGPACSIGPNVVIHAPVTLGARVRVGAGTVLGHDGFGYERNAIGVPLHFPHLGRLVVEDDVAIGNMCSISRGTLDDTRIGKHTKIDDHVYVAHNVAIEDNVLVMAGVRLNGRAHIGAASWLGTGALVREGRAVGPGATIGMGSVVVASVAAGAVVAGNPAKVLR